MQTYTFSPTEIQFMAMLGWTTPKEQAFVYDHFYLPLMDDCLYRRLNGELDAKIPYFEDWLTNELKIQSHEYN